MAITSAPNWRQLRNKAAKYQKMFLLFQRGGKRRAQFFYERNIINHQWTSENAKEAAAAAKKAALDTLGQDWNHYSNALLPEVSSGFGHVLDQVKTKFSGLRYLEIGSNKGLSMAFFHLYTQNWNPKSTLVSIDPYYEEGYVEGAGAPAAAISPTGSEGLSIEINKTTRDEAYRLYENIGANVRHLEKTSAEGLVDLLKNNERFNLIYVDGSHEDLNPLADIGTSLLLLEQGGFIILDDWNWDAVYPIKALMDEAAAEKIFESWKIAIYRVESNALSGADRVN